MQFDTFKFAVAMENTINRPFYITEKVFDAFKGGSVPIYWPRRDLSFCPKLFNYKCKALQERRISPLPRLPESKQVSIL